MGDHWRHSITEFGKDCNMTRLEDLIQKFWEIENALNKSQPKKEVERESHFIRTVSGDTSERYTIWLPFRDANNRLGNSRKMALIVIVAQT